MKKSLLLTIVFATAATQACDTPPVANWPKNKVLDATNNNSLSRSAVLNQSFRFEPADGNSPDQGCSPSAAAQASTTSVRPAAQTPSADRFLSYSTSPLAAANTSIASNGFEENSLVDGSIARPNTPDDQINNIDLEILRVHARLFREEQDKRNALITYITTPVYVGDGIYASPLSSLQRPTPVRFTAGTPIINANGMSLTPMHRKS